MTVFAEYKLPQIITITIITIITSKGRQGAGDRELGCIRTCLVPLALCFSPHHFFFLFLASAPSPLSLLILLFSTIILHRVHQTYTTPSYLHNAGKDMNGLGLSKAPFASTISTILTIPTILTILTIWTILTILSVLTVWTILILLSMVLDEDNLFCAFLPVLDEDSGLVMFSF